jgi:tetratricopeptide (TPR) repeat protein
MSQYTVREVESMLGISRAVIERFVGAGFVSPTRGKRREYRFSFQDLIVLRTAQGLSSAKVPPRKIARSLERLRSELPEELPLTGLRIAALGNDVVVREGARQWRADSGQYLFDFEVSPAAGSVSFLGRAAVPADGSAQYWFDEGCALEEGDGAKARAAYRKALDLEPSHVGAQVNLGYLLHAAGELEAAERVYRGALQWAPRNAIVLFNLGVVLEDLQRAEEAVSAYRAAIEVDRELADAHYNLARLEEARGQAQDALRHYSEYRRLQS